RERRRDEHEKSWNIMSAVILSPVSAAGFILTFLGINASQVDNASMWNDRYAPLYFIATLMALSPVALIVLPRLRDRALLDMRGSLATDVLVTLLGALIGGLAVLRASLVSSLAVANAVAEAVGLVLVVLGAASWVLRRRLRGWR